jgi:hypothetical protein
LVREILLFKEEEEIIKFINKKNINLLKVYQLKKIIVPNLKILIIEIEYIEIIFDKYC